MRTLSLILALVSALGLYPRGGIVVDVDREADRVTIEDGAGLLWDLDGAEDWCIGDGAALLMWDNGTPESIYDDAIVSARYSAIDGR